jgi:hypothetical protein
MALYQHLSGVTEENEGRPQSGDWKFEPGTLGTHAFIVTTTREMTVNCDDDDDENDDVGQLLSMTASASCRQIRTI